MVFVTKVYNFTKNDLIIYLKQANLVVYKPYHMRLFKQNPQTLASPIRCQSPKTLSQEIKPFILMPTLRHLHTTAQNTRQLKAVPERLESPEAM